MARSLCVGETGATGDSGWLKQTKCLTNPFREKSEILTECVFCQYTLKDEIWL